MTVILTYRQGEALSSELAGNGDGRISLSQTNNGVLHVERADGRRIAYDRDGTVRPSVWAGNDADCARDGLLDRPAPVPGGRRVFVPPTVLPDTRHVYERFNDVRPLTEADEPEPRVHEPFCELRPDHKHGCYVTPPYLRGA